jgi:TrmH family RNA methyltransferase
VITSPHNDKLKEVRRLQRRRERRFVAEGEDLLEAAAAAGWPAVYELRAGVDVEPELLDRVSGLGSGTRALGVFEARWGAPIGPLCLALWGVRDPGNVGAVLRSALAFGAASVALGPGCADPFGPKAVRASMGAIFAVPVARVESVAQLPAPRVALVARAGDPMRGPLHGTLVIGAERTGLPSEVVEACERVAHVPIAGDSLNAAMAATVGLYEASGAGRSPTAGDRRTVSERGAGCPAEETSKVREP